MGRIHYREPHNLISEGLIHFHNLYVTGITSSARGTRQACLQIQHRLQVLQFSHLPLTSVLRGQRSGGHLFFHKRPYVPLMPYPSQNESDQVLIFNLQHCWKWQPAVAVKNNNWQTLWLVLALALSYEIQIPGNQMFL